MQDSITFPSIKLRYESLFGDKITYWPLVRISFSSKSASIPQPMIALVDSGANISILRPDIAEFLGFSRNSLEFNLTGKSVSGLYGSAILSEKVVVSIYGYQFTMKFHVVDNPKLAFPCILGEDSIFQWARIDFQKYKGFFELKFRKDLD